MLDHEFSTVKHFRVGPIVNNYGYIFTVVSIDDTWIMSWQTPYGQKYYKYFSDHEDVVDAIKLLNQDRRF